MRVCSHVFVFLCVCVGICACSYVWKSEVKLRCCSSRGSSLVFFMISQWDLELADYTRPAGQWAPGMPGLFSQWWDYNYAWPHPAFLPGCWGLNSGSHACPASSLQTEPSSQSSRSYVFSLLSLDSHRLLCGPGISGASEGLWTGGCHKPGIPKCGSWALQQQQSITWRLVKTAHLHSLAQIYWAESLGGGGQLLRGS